MDPRIEKLLNLPLWQRLLLLVLILALLGTLYTIYLYQPQRDKLTQLTDKQEKLSRDLVQKRRIAKQLPKFKQEYEKIKLKLQASLEELPNKKEIPDLLQDTASLAKDNGLDVLQFKPGQEQPREFYARVPVNLEMQGSYHQVGLFADAVAHMSRIVNLQKLKLRNPRQQQGRVLLDISCQAITFRFLEQQAAAKKKKGGS